MRYNEQYQLDACMTRVWYLPGWLHFDTLIHCTAIAIPGEIIFEYVQVILHHQ